MGSEYTREAQQHYQQVGRDFVDLYRSFRQLFAFKAHLNEHDQVTLERSLVDLVVFGIDLDVDDYLEPKDNYEEVYKEVVSLVRKHGLVFCRRLKCPFRKRPAD